MKKSILGGLDAVFNRVYGWRGNPIYQSGALTVALLAVVLITGVYLLLYYRISAPWASVARITDQVWVGRWVRGLHRFASDAAVVTAAIHALRLFLQNRSWGPRTLAWVTGLLLLGLIFVCGWTGYVMIWDVQAQVLAQEGARWLDVIPLFSEPISRGFGGDRPIPAAFFFLNLFLHVALPVGLAVLLWLHVSRVARPVLLPPRRLTGIAVGALLALSVLWPVGMAPPAELLRLPGPAPYDFFFVFFVPFTRGLPPWAVWTLAGSVGLVLLLVPVWARPRPAARLAPSVVDEQICTGCEQCYLDCPYEAIAMVPRDRAGDGVRSEFVARVDPARCVSCGICAGSCAPMGVGPPGRTGRDQMSGVREFVRRRRLRPGTVVLIACERGAGGSRALAELDGVPVLPVSCAGNLHTSVIEFLVRSGTGGVLVVSCPPRDCWNREGPRWLEQRVYHDREAELQPRVDRRRVRLHQASAGEGPEVRAALARFRRELEALDTAAGESAIEIEQECDGPAAGPGAGR